MQENAAADVTGGLVAGRYVLEKRIGQGGMALVYQALDNASGRRIALKQLRPNGSDRQTQRNRELFEHEFHTLAQLAHPRIVSVLDYGIDGDAAYYTMELLDGGDLFEQSPMPWQRACAVARDICSALSLVHSRRLVFRDVSPRNIRCTGDTNAKLLDFGALAPMGSSRVAVCTPTVAAPEVAHWQALDARSDLYALGATLYYTLTGHNAYPARTFADLDSLWTDPEPLRPPSRYTKDIPKALDVLVMDLLQLDPHLRPASAAEVSQRLAAIAGLHTDEHLLSSQAYLTTPILVGRNGQLATVRRRLRRLMRHDKGAAVLVSGPAGSGRSRFLDACGLEAKLGGVTVLRASPADASEGSYAVARALVSQLREVLPEQVAEIVERHRDTLSGLLPGVVDEAPSDSAAPAKDDVRAHGQAALRSFFVDVANRKPLLVEVDDVEQFDADSRALIALLAHESRRRPLLVLAAMDSEAPVATDAARLLVDAAKGVALGPLDADQTHALLVSIFGDVPHLASLVRRMDALAAGNPKDLMRLAQHLVDRGVLRFSGGTWTLPDRIDDTELPATMALALSATAGTLDADARSLSEAMAQCPDQRFSPEECLALTAHGERARLFRSLDELVAKDILLSTPDGYALASKVWVGPLQGTGEPAMHLRLAQVFEGRGDGMRAARHFFRAGRESEGIDALVQFSEASNRKTDSNSEAYIELLSTLPEDWQKIFDTGIRLCREQGRPATDVFKLQRRAGGILGQCTAQSNGLLAKTAHSFARAAGLDIYASLDESLDPGARVQQAFMGAGKRYYETPEQERFLDPMAAIQELARMLVACAGNAARTLDVEEWEQLPSIAPLTSLSPAVALVNGLLSGFGARLSGRFELACDIYQALLKKLEAAEGTGLDGPYIDSMRGAFTAMMGIMHAALGLPSAQEWADKVANDRFDHGSALAIRMLDRLWQGDVVEAGSLARQWELWRLEQPRQQAGEVLTLLWEMQAHAASDDLTRTSQSLESIEQVAHKIASWQPIADWARGEYERIRGDSDAALAALDRALTHMRPGHHQVWALAAGARLKVLCNQERYAEARAQGEADLAAAEAARLGYVVSYVRMPLAFAVAKLGDAEAAWEHIRAVLETFEALGTRGLNLGLAHEAAARVAAALEDTEAFDHHAQLCSASFHAHPNPALAAKYRRLVHLARRSLPPGSRTEIGLDSVSALKSELQTVLAGCSTANERLRGGLELIVREAGARNGFLYGLVDGRAHFYTQTGEQSLSPELEEAAKTFLEQELQEDYSTTADITDGSAEDRLGSVIGNPTTQDGTEICYRPVMLGHRSAEGFLVTGLVVLELDCRDRMRPTSEIAVLFSRLMVAKGDLEPHIVTS